MCGIAGIYKFNEAVDPAQVRRMTDSIAHRGPDGEGFWSNPDNSLCLGHRRLAIIDLSERGVQPMHYLDRYTLVLNGEIYNYIELKKELRDKGYSFHSETDSEVLLAAFDAYKYDCLEKLDGMFAFAIYDRLEEKLFCARDRFGEKPFYYHYEANRHFYFGSEIKALFAGGVPRKMNERMIYFYLTFEIVNDPFNKEVTFYDQVSKLEAAHYLLIDKQGKITKKRYWDIVLNQDVAYPSYEAACEKFISLFNQSTERRLRSDVPVGSSFSGGLDSTAIVLTLERMRRNTGFTQHVFSARTHDENLDEGEFMKEIDHYPDIIRHDIWLDGPEMINNISTILHFQDEPIPTTAIIAQYKVMQKAKEENITVLLDGQGADEAMGGYIHFFEAFFNDLYLHDKKLFKRERKAYRELRGEGYPVNLRFRINARFPALLRFLGKMRRQFTYPEYLRFFNKDFISRFKKITLPFPDFHNLNEDLRFNMLDTGLENLLRYADRNAMAHSREVRLPYLNHELIEFLFILPATYKIKEGKTKSLMRTAFKDLVPASVISRVLKLGYATPQDEWMKLPSIQNRIKESRELLEQKNILSKNSPDTSVFNWRILNIAYFLSE